VGKVRFLSTFQQTFQRQKEKNKSGIQHQSNHKIPIEEKGLKNEKREPTKELFKQIQFRQESQYLISRSNTPG
jgi:hypothetical protein